MSVITSYFALINKGKPPVVVARSKAWVCGGTLAGIADSNPAGFMVVCLLWVLRVASYRPLLPAGHSSKGVLRCVVSWSSHCNNNNNNNNIY